MRLTRNVSMTSTPFYACNKSADKFDGSELINANQELGQLEDILENHKIESLEELDDLLLYAKKLKNIEKELGVDLITLYKCFKSTKFYVKNLFNEIIEVKSDIVRFDMGHGYVYFGADYCPLSSYGTTWALTEGELL